MNYSMVMYIVGWILNFEAAFMLPSCLVAVIYQEKCGISFLITMAAALVIGIPLTVRNPKTKTSIPGKDLPALPLDGLY